MAKVGFTTYIYGDSYQDFIPWILYTVGKAYPEYHTILFINNAIREDLKPMIETIRTQLYDNFKIIEHSFDDCPKMNPVKAQSLRWVVWDDSFKGLDYLYYIDSDMFFIREPIPLHEQHIRHMQFIKSPCISNIIRKRNLRISYKNRYLTYFNLKYGGVKCIAKQIVTPFAFRLSGLHFVKVPEYFNLLDSSRLSHFRNQIYTGNGLKSLGFYNDECFLYNMAKRQGYDMSVFAVQQTSSSMFGFDNPDKGEFRPHHGIHLGIFRQQITELSEDTLSQLNSTDYKYYIDKFQQGYIKDPLFNLLLKSSPNRIKTTFSRLFEYYKIKPDFPIELH